MKKILAIILTVSLLFSVRTSSRASELTNPSLLSQMSEEECIAFVTSNGIEIPKELDGYENLGLFIKNAISAVESDPNYIFTFNYHVTYNLANEIKVLVNNYYGISDSSNLATPSSRSTSSLLYSTTVGPWSDSYLYYNCYAYVVDQTGYMYYHAPHPGYYTLDAMFSIFSSIEFWAALTATDLTALGYNCVYTSNNYFSVMDMADTHTIINLRKCSTPGLEDFHYMRLDNGYWYHKPGNTHLLKFNSQLPGTTWSNECSFRGTIHPADRYYTDTIYFFAFRENHVYTTTYADDHYHSGNRHYYYMHYECDCGDEYYGWKSFSCNGPPCLLEYTSIPNDPILTTK